MAVIADPTGAALCLWEPRASIGATLVNTPGSMAWNDLVTPDPETAIDFYGKLFGWTFEEMPESGGYHVIRNGELSNGGIFPLEGPAELDAVLRPRRRRAAGRRHRGSRRKAPQRPGERARGHVRGAGGSARRGVRRLDGPVRRLSAPRPPSRAGRRPGPGAPRCSPTRSRTRSRASSSPSPRAGWSAGSRSGCRPASAHSPAARTASARTSTSRRRGG